jgi:hypothetical protein
VEEAKPRRRVPQLVAFFASHDGRVLQPTTLTVISVSEQLERPLVSFVSAGLGQAVSLNAMLWMFKRMVASQKGGSPFDVHGKVRALWIEDDIMLDVAQAPEIAEMIRVADQNHYNIVTPYSTGHDDRGEPCPHCGRTGEDSWVYYHQPNDKTGEIGRPFTLKEIQALKPYDRVDGLAGLGFYYGAINTDYAFHEGEYNGRDRFGAPSWAGIDWNYFLDNRTELRHYPVSILHDKPHFWSNRAAIAKPPTPAAKSA